VALSDFMPYGAPELLDGSDRRLARSTLTASAVVTLVFPVIGLFIARNIEVPHDFLVSFADTITKVQVFETPPLVEPVTPVAPVVPDDATPVPVPDAVTETHDVEPAPAVTATGPAGTTSQPGGGIVVPKSGDGDDVIPKIGDFVYRDVEPGLVKSVDPVYPDMAKEAGVEGVVRVLMLVGLNGHVEQAVVAPGGSVMLLDDAALAAARQCVFTPALSNQHPVRVWVMRAYRFTLHGN